MGKITLYTIIAKRFAGSSIISPDLVEHYRTWVQLRQEAGIKGSVTLSNIEALKAVAQKWGIKIEVIEKTRSKSY